MSTIQDRGVIDLTMVEDGRFVLVIVDDLEWSSSTRHRHARQLQDKLNDYLGFIASGQAEELQPGLRPVIRIVAEHPYSRYCLDLLMRIRTYVQSKDNLCDIEWTHPAGKGPFDDGFSDDFVFDANKVYPRLKKNWAEDPLEGVSLMPPSADAPDYPDQMVMMRVMDSFVGLFMQDMGDVFTYLTYDMLPEGFAVEGLERAAFDNLVTDVDYQLCETREPGIFGIVAGGNFEAESLLLDEIWDAVAKELDGDLIISVPTKDIVYVTKAADDNLTKKMLKMARDMLESNLRETPYLVFCRDVFVYSRFDGVLRASEEWML